MEVVSTTCAYHTGKAMVAICQQCRSSICELDINKIGRGSYQSDLCYFCYKKNIQRFYWIMLIFCLVSLFFSFFLFIATFQQTLSYPPTRINNTAFETPFEIVGIIGLISLIIIYIVNRYKLKAATAKYLSEPATRSVLASEQNMQKLQQNSWIALVCGLISFTLFLFFCIAAYQQPARILQTYYPQSGARSAAYTDLALLLGSACFFLVLFCLSVYVYNHNRKKLKTITAKNLSEPIDVSAMISNQNMPTISNLVSLQNRQNIQDSQTENSFNRANIESKSKETYIAPIADIVCKSCGNKLSSDDVFCSNCGSKRN